MIQHDIPFNTPYLHGDEQKYIGDAIKRRTFSAAGHYSRLCEKRLEAFTQAKEVLLTSSCTHALEMCALLLDIKEGDEIIMPSFNFVSAANAFVLRGAKIIFVDIDPDTMNIDAAQIPPAITPKTKAILVVHYGGIACNMEAVLAIARQNKLPVIEDAAHAIDAYHRGHHLGTLGDLGTLSFHATKNIHCGEGGALLINNPIYSERAAILREKGTNRQAFMKGEVDKYTWVDMGSSYLMSEVSAAFLYAQLQSVKRVTEKRLRLWNFYQKELLELEQQGRILLPAPPSYSRGNGHIFYIKCQHKKERTALVDYLSHRGVKAYFHYIPLHASKAGRLFSHFSGIDNFTSIASDQLLRLPVYCGMKQENSVKVIDSIKQFFRKNQ